MFVGFKYALSKSVVGGIENAIPSDISQLGSGSEFVTNGDSFVSMKDTIWDTSKEWLNQNGITNPTSEEIMNVSKQVALDNHIAVQEWGIEGNPIDTSMQQGHLLNYKGAATVLAAINVARSII